MNKFKILLTLLVLVSFSCQSQNTNCNRTVKFKSDAKLIPKGICLEEGFEFSYVYDHADITGNGLKDFIAQWRKKDLKDGDTLYLSVYQQIDSSNYELFRTFDNFYPVYFKDYDFEYDVPDSLLNELKGAYNGVDPLNQLEFNKSEILIHLQPGVLDHYFLHYRYDPNDREWYLERRIYSEENYEGSLREVTNEYLWDQKLSIDKFNYFDYL